MAVFKIAFLGRTVYLSLVLEPVACISCDFFREMIFLHLDILSCFVFFVYAQGRPVGVGNGRRKNLFLAE